VGEERDDRRPQRQVDGDEERDERDEAAQGLRSYRRRGVYLPQEAGIPVRMWLLLLLILAVLLLGVWGAVKVVFWVLLIALAVAIIAGFLGRGLFTRRSAL
jgi:hypothetical protein